MRMWMVKPEIMCQRHLCGEHVELHMFLSHLKSGKGIDGYLKNNCLQPRMLWFRHDEIRREMIRRKYNHKSPIELHECACTLNYSIEQQYWEIDKAKSLSDLLQRCPECKKQYEGKWAKGLWWPEKE